MTEEQNTEGNNTQTGLNRAGTSDPPRGNQPPPPRPAGNTNPPANPLLPSDDELMTVDADVQANKVASKSMINEVLQSLRAEHPNASAVDLFTLAWACYHNGSSRYVTLSGNSPNQIPLAAIKDKVEDHGTLRQFCMYYAKLCYHKGKESKTPPATWAVKGYKEAAKYAAFDFFGGVLNDAAPKPPSGLKHHPDEVEIAAHAVNASMAIIESRGQDNQYSARGNMLAMQQVRSAPPTPLITFN